MHTSSSVQGSKGHQLPRNCRTQVQSWSVIYRQETVAVSSTV